MDSGFRKRARDIKTRMQSKQSSLTAADIIETVELSNSMTVQQCVDSVKEQMVQVNTLLHDQPDNHELSKQLRILKRYVNLLILKLDIGENH